MVSQLNYFSQLGYTVVDRRQWLLNADRMKKKPKDETRVVSFRVSAELYDKLQAFGEDERDETGLPLNPHTAARRLMLRALQEVARKEKK